MRNELLTQERLKKLLEYDTETGQFMWRVFRASNAKTGDIAGSLKVDGYVSLCVDGIQYQAHRLAWLYVYGSFPKFYIDHINGIKHDNRISNLREVDQSLNMRNTDISVANTSGCKGVSFSQRDKLWYSYIGIPGEKRRKYLGTFKDKMEAIKARRNAEQELWHNNKPIKRKPRDDSNRRILTHGILLRTLHYDSKTGEFTWKIDRNHNSLAGTTAGYFRPDGYISICIFGKIYLAHRLAWFYVHKVWPKFIDHINKNKSDNRIENLNEVSSCQNAMNRQPRRDNKHGITGVSFNSQFVKWKATITVNKISKFLGQYENFDDAVCARLAGEQCLNWNKCDSNSPAYKYVKSRIRTCPQ